MFLLRQGEGKKEETGNVLTDIIRSTIIALLKYNHYEIVGFVVPVKERLEIKKEYGKTDEKCAKPVALR